MMEIVKEHYPNSKQYTLEQMDQGWELVKQEEKS